MSKIKTMRDFKSNKTFGELLRQMREHENLTLKDVALEIGMDISLLAKIERNERQATKMHISNFAKFFKVQEKDLLSAFLSDQIAYKILDEDADLNILKVAEEKVKYGIIKNKN